MTSILETLEEIIGYKATRESDTSIMFSCPFAGTRHTSGYDKNPSFSYNKDDNYYYCFSCKSTGNLNQLKHELDSDIDISNYKYTKKKVSLLDKKISKETPLDKEIYLNIFYDPWKNKKSKDYLTSRGISKETSEKLGLGYDAYRDIITFPIYDESLNLYGFQGRRIVEGEYGKVLTYVTKLKDKLLGIQFYNKKLPFLVIEGLFGYAKLHEIGASNYFNIVATMGSKLTQEKIDILRQYRNSVYILPDNDHAGRLMVYEKKVGVIKDSIYSLAKTNKVYLPSWPNGKVDPDQLNLDEVKHLCYTSNRVEHSNQVKLF